MKSSSVKQRIQEFFFMNPSKRLRITELARSAHTPLPSTIRYANELVTETILERQIIGSTAFYTTQATSPRYRFEKQQWNRRQIQYSGLIEYLTKEFAGAPILIFGSYDRGEDIETSDIDLYIESDRTETIDLTRFEKILGHDIQLFIHPSLGKIPNPHLANSIINGTVLAGTIEVF